jgi:hypothetical protein
MFNNLNFMKGLWCGCIYIYIYVSMYLWHNLLVWKLTKHNLIVWKSMSFIQVTCSRLTSMYVPCYLGCLVNRYIAVSPNVYLVTKHFYFQLFDLAKSGNYFCWRNTLCSKSQWLDGEDILIGFRVCPTSFQIGLQKSVVTRRKGRGTSMQHSNFFWLWKHEFFVCLLLVVVILFAMENWGDIVFCSMFPTYLLRIY